MFDFNLKGVTGTRPLPPFSSSRRLFATLQFQFGVWYLRSCSVGLRSFGWIEGYEMCVCVFCPSQHGEDQVTTLYIWTFFKGATDKVILTLTSNRSQRLTSMKVKKKGRTSILPVANRVISVYVLLCACVFVPIEPLCDSSETILSPSQRQIPLSLPPVTHTQTHTCTGTIPTWYKTPKIPVEFPFFKTGLWF